MWIRNGLLQFFLIICLYVHGQDEPNPYYLNDNSTTDWGVHAALKFDFVAHNFSEFEDALGVYNVELMNVNSGLLAFELGGRLNRWQTALSFGLSTRKDEYLDSLSLEFSTTQYEFALGYIAIQRIRFALIPKFAFMWRRNKLLNSDLERRITMDSYLHDRDLDIRLNHTYGIVGLDFAYKMYRYNIFYSDYWTVGCFAGYRFKLNELPWVYSRQNRLLNNNQIDFSHASTSFYIAFHF